MFGLLAIKLFADERSGGGRRRRPWCAASDAHPRRAAPRWRSPPSSAFLTLYVIFETGPDVLSVLSLLVLALFFFGIFGALGPGPETAGALPRAPGRAETQAAALAGRLALPSCWRGRRGGLRSLTGRGRAERAAAGPRPPASSLARRRRPEPLAGGGTAPSTLAVRLDDASDPVRLRFKRRRAPACCSTSTPGSVLWRRDPTRVLPIASLTKMMTALLVVQRVPAGEKVRITKEALRYQGSGVGMFKRGRRVGVETMLQRPAAAVRQRRGDRARAEGGAGRCRASWR